jgi:hypothetical protein
MALDPVSNIPAGWIRPRQRSHAGRRRAGALADVQLVCGAGDFELDVLVREFDGPSAVELLGQLTRADALHEPAPRVPLSLVSADETPVSSTQTNSFGEFGFDRRPTAAYGLRVGDGPDAPCVLVWDGN